MNIIDNLLAKSAKILLAVEEHGLKELTEKRLAACNQCENYDQEHKQCTVCGCFMDVKTTLVTNRNPHAGGRIEITHCPLGRWDDLHIAQMYNRIDNLI